MRLQRKLLLTFLPIVLLPLAIAGSWSGTISSQQLQQQAELRLRNQAKVSAALTHKELERKMTLLSVLALDPTILEASRKTAEEAQAAKLPQQSISKLEAQFAKTRQFSAQPVLQNYLQTIATRNNLAALFLTDRYGFNVAYSQPTSDFVQSDEHWWQAGKQFGKWIDNPKFDESANQITVSLTHAIVDPQSNEFLGVLKAGYDSTLAEHLTGELRNLRLFDSERIQILGIDSKAVTVTTLSAEPNRTTQPVIGGDAILQRAQEVLKEAQERLAQDSTPQNPEEFNIKTHLFVQNDRWFAIAKVPGANWVAVSSIQMSQVNAATYHLIAIFAGVFLSLAAISTLVILRFSHHLSAPLNRLAKAAQHATEKADFAVQVPVSSHDEEISVLANSFTQLLQRVQVLLNEQATVQKHLEAANQTLEDKVDERTQALKEQTERLEQTLEELQRTQAQVVQNEKMSSLGQLVAGIAHEINNPVSFIHGNLSYLQDNTADLLALLALYQQTYPEPSNEIADKIEDIDLAFLKADIPKSLDSMNIGTDRIREIIKSLRIFSRLDEADVKAIEIHEGIDSTLMILQHRLKARPDRPEIQVTKNYGELPLVECYAGQLNQVFMNILSNAIDALDDLLLEHPTHKPHIHICTDLLECDAIAITIADNGTGIPEDLQQRIFDPFFTTKAVGKGTGMGMSISHQVITEKHNGQLKCVSVLGKGTEFTIQIPVYQGIGEPDVCDSPESKDESPQDEPLVTEVNA